MMMQIIIYSIGDNMIIMFLSYVNHDKNQTTEKYNNL